MTTTTDQVYLERLLERNPKLADHLRLMETTMDINDFCGGLTAFNITPLNNMNVTDIDDIPFYSYDCENLVKQMVDHFISSQYTHTKPSTIMLMILNFAVFVAAVIGNTLVIIVVARNAHMRNVTNYFLVNLAVADLLVAMFCVPFQLGYDIYTNWVYGTAMCKLTGFLQGISVTVSILTLTAMSIERYLAIKHPMRARRISKVNLIRKVIVVIWILALVITSPILYVKEVLRHQVFTVDVFTCTEVWPNGEISRMAYSMVLLMFMYVLPAGLIFTAYTLIGRRLCTEEKRLTRSATSLPYNQKCRNQRNYVTSVLKGRRKIARMLLVVAFLFVICWLPYNVLTVWRDFHIGKPSDSDVKIVISIMPFASLLGHANSAFNPIVYSFLHKSFRKHFKTAFQCGVSRGPPSNHYLPNRMRPSISRSTSTSQSTRWSQVSWSRSMAALRERVNSRRSGGRVLNTRKTSFKSMCTNSTHSNGLHQSYVLQYNSRQMRRKRQIIIMQRPLALASTITEESSNCQSSVSRRSSNAHSYAMNKLHVLKEETNQENDTSPSTCIRMLLRTESAPACYDEVPELQVNGEPRMEEDDSVHKVEVGESDDNDSVFTPSTCADYNVTIRKDSLLSSTRNQFTNTDQIIGSDDDTDDIYCHAENMTRQNANLHHLTLEDNVIEEDETSFSGDLDLGPAVITLNRSPRVPVRTIIYKASSV